MIRVFLLFPLLLVLGGVTVYLTDMLKQEGPGYVLIYYNNYSIETTLWFAVVAVALSLIFLCILFKLIKFLVRSCWRFGLLPRRYSMGQSKKLHSSGLLAYIDDQWGVASKNLFKAGKRSETPFIDYVASVHASLRNKDIVQAKKSFEKANQCTDTDPVSLACAAVDIAYATKDDGNAEQRLHQSLLNYPKEPRLLLKAADIYSKTQRWQALSSIMPQLRKQKLLPEDQLDQYSLQVAIDDIDEAIKYKEDSKLQKVWKQHSELHDNRAFSLAYLRGLAALNLRKQAEKQAVQQLKKHWDEGILTFYASLDVENKQKQYQFLQSFLEIHGDNPALQLALGKVAANLHQWLDAEKHLQKSISVAPSVKAYHLLAKIYSENQRNEKSIKAMESAISLANFE